MLICRMNKNKEILDEIAGVITDIMNEDAYAFVDAATKRQIYYNTMDTVSKELRKRDDRREFEEHYNQWRLETMLDADENKRYSNEHYVAIVRMSKRALPFIGEKLTEGEYGIVPACWDIELDDPVRMRTYDIKKAADAWIIKLREKGYIVYEN